MKSFKFTYRTIAFVAISLLFTTVSTAQIGIGTTSPEGAIDLNTTSYGLVYPRVALTATNSASPVINPRGGGPAVGTVVYNTATTTTGSNDVSPGIYAWDGSKWTAQFKREDYAKFEQTGGCQRTTIRESNSNPNPNDDDNIAGLTNQTFTPVYSGTYRVEVKTNFAAGEIADFTSLDQISLATMEGSFFFSLSGTGVDIDPTPAAAAYDYSEGWIYTHAYATHNEIESPALEDNNNIHYASSVFYVTLIGGDTYTFNLSNCTYTGHAYFLNNGDTGDGRGHIGHEFPCTVEFMFID